MLSLETFGHIADRPSVVSVETFVPPAVEHTDVEDAVHAGLLAARAACLQRRSRIVQPGINTLSKEVCRMNVVVFDKRDVTCESIVGSDRIDFMDKVLAVVVCRM